MFLPSALSRSRGAERHEIRYWVAPCANPHLVGMWHVIDMHVLEIFFYDVALLCRELNGSSAPHPLVLLRVRRDWPRCRAAEKGDELAPPHWSPLRVSAVIVSD
jgi:hypothetical protein